MKQLLPYFFACFAAYCWVQLLVPRMRHKARWRGGAPMSARSQFCSALFLSLLFCTRFKPVASVVVLLAFADFACLWFFGEMDRRRYVVQRTGVEAAPTPIAKVFQKPETIIVLFLFVSIVTVMIWIFLK